MKAARATVVVTTVALLALAATAWAQRGQVATNQAVLTSMYGDVQTRHGTAGYRTARLNEVLVPGDGIKTGASARAELSVGGGGYVRMDENSQVLVTAIASGGTTTFQAIVGGIWVTIEQALSGTSKFEVRMPSAVASVTGTVFRCEVAADGESSTYVYEGEVAVDADGEVVRVAPDERCRVPRDMRTVIDRFNLAGDDEAAWVMYNRHRDIVSRLGDPQIIVALREDGLTEMGSWLASRAVAGQLALHGLQSTSVVEAGVTDFSFNDDGTIRWGRRPTADYCVIGDVALVQVREINPGLFSARVSADIRLVHDGDSTALTAIQATVPGAGEDEREAVMAALASLGRRVGQGLAPRIIREMMERSTGVVRIDISGANRDQLAHLRQFVVQINGVLRTAPLVLPGDRVSLAVVTSLTPQDIGRALHEAAGDAVQVVLAGDRVLYVQFRQTGGMGAQLQAPGTRAQSHLAPAHVSQPPPPDRPRRPRNLPQPPMRTNPGTR